MTLLLVGLGNPGPKYELTRHNAGFIALDLLAARFRCRWEGEKFEASFGRGLIHEIDAILLKPLTFMNLSGRSVASAARFYKVPAENIVAIVDDVDVPPGKVKARVGGGAGGHNGVRSMISELGTESFHRIKLGIGKPTSGIAEDVVRTWVLSPFSNEELENLRSAMFEEVLVRLQGICYGVQK